MAGVTFKRLLLPAVAVAAPLLLASPSAQAAMATGTVSVVITSSGGGGVNDSPVMSDQTMATVAENQGAGVSAGTVTATDPDSGDTLSFAITANSGGLFAISSATGEITTTASLDFEAAPSHTLTVQVTDSGLLSTSATVTIPVGDVNETTPPPVVSNTGNNQNNSGAPITVDPGLGTNRGFANIGAPTGGDEAGSAPPAAETTTEEETTAAATDSGAAATGGQPSAAQRFARESQSASQLFGQPTSIGVVGNPNQNFSVSLPGQTSFATGSEVVNVAGFSHNAGLTPALGDGGAGTFAVGAQLSAEGGDSVGSVSVDSGDTAGGDTAGGDTTGGGTTGEGGTAAAGDSTGEGGGANEGGDSGAGPLVFAGPIVTRSPFVSVVVSFN